MSIKVVGRSQVACLFCCLEFWRWRVRRRANKPLAEESSAGAAAGGPRVFDYLTVDSHARACTPRTGRR